MKQFYPGFLLKNLFHGKVFPNNLIRHKRILFVFLAVFFQSISGDILAQNIYSYSYQNVSRNNGGGTLEKGDTIEVRALVKVEVTTPNFYYIDTIRAGTAYVNNSLRVITNEGLTFRGPYTDTDNDDLGVYDVSGGIPRIRVNLGVGAQGALAGTAANRFGNTTGGGTVTPNEKPKFYGKTLFVVAYRLVITAEFDDIIYLTGNYYWDSTYTKKEKGKDVKYADPKNHRFNYAGIKVIQNQDLCINFSSATFTAESDFGLGSLQNRPTGATVPGYNKVPLNANDPQDGNYAIANNTSANGTTNDAGPYSSNPARVFNVWDIVGDHTGAADPIKGNPPTPAGQPGGYMLVVNAAYPTGEAYRDQIKNVCPNTYYEFSAWVRNICGKCSTDSNGVSPGTPGVQPNLAFTINDIDYYTTGNIPYTQEWVKRGFIYKTGPSETQFNITIKNNAPGGGGNDWVLDDIKLATCYPNLIMNPSDTAKLCADYLVHLSDTVKSYFNNYTSFCWQKSTDGVNWVNTNNCGTAVPVFKNGLWEYVVDTVFTVAASDSGMHFRVKVATTDANLLEDQCAVENSQKVYLQVFSMDCRALEEKFLNFTGNIIKGYAELKWTPKNQHDLGKYEIERSSDGINFKKIGVINTSESLNQTGYGFIDPDRLNSTAFYRLKLVSKEGRSKIYSKTIHLFNANDPFKVSSPNPFKGNLKLDIFLPVDGKIDIQISNVLGKLMVKKEVTLSKGNSHLTLSETNSLPQGWYIIRTIHNGKAVQNRLFKSN
jgi:hypothetical protein